MHSWTPFVVINIFLFPTCGKEELWEIQTICSRQEHEILIFQLLKQLYIHSLSLIFRYFGGFIDRTAEGLDRKWGSLAPEHGGDGDSVL